MVSNSCGLVDNSVLNGSRESWVTWVVSRIVYITCLMGHMILGLKVVSVNGHMGYGLRSDKSCVTGHVVFDHVVYAFSHLVP